MSYIFYLLNLAILIQESKVKEDRWVVSAGFFSEARLAVECYPAPVVSGDSGDTRKPIATRWEKVVGYASVSRLVSMVFAFCEQ